MTDFAREYQLLNKEQREAVDYIDGPLLVLAGPGTGKTQLLTLRVANILTKTDTLPQNIICLTFTENGAENMRRRLTRFIGQAAYDVTISTYHAFGSDLIRRYPEYFSEIRLQNPIDELGRHQIVQEIVDHLSYSNPLKQSRHHLGDLVTTISEVKRALLTSKDLRAIAAENATIIKKASHATQTIFGAQSRLSGSLAKSLPLFAKFHEQLGKLVPTQPAHERLGTLTHIALDQLQEAIETAEATKKTTSLTAWKNTWLAKDADNHFVFAGDLVNRRIEALADVLETYQASLDAKGLYDFDDMILRSIQALEQHKDLTYTLQEQYLYILLDEFQDTNAAQLRLIELLSDNPVHEGRPNVMAVGDDDQAIYAFQGAQYSNMLDFYRMYRQVKVINLTENYRSHADLLIAAQRVAEQISERLHRHFDGMTKSLVAANNDLPAASLITRREFLSDLAQYDWIAHHIESLIKSGTPPHEIAVLAPKHKQLEPLVPYLSALDIPIRYEKRENILEAPVVKQLLSMCRLVLALHEGNERQANALWPEVLSFDFWQLPVRDIWQVSWQVARDESWSKVLLDNKSFEIPALLFLALANKVEQETCELMLDYLIGTEAINTGESDKPSVSSPLREFYTGVNMQQTNPELFYQTLSHLKVLRERLRDHQATIDHTLKLQDLITFVDMYQAADERMINTSPYSQQADAVQLMTVFKAKGLEFEHVFLPSCSDDVWGGSSRGNTNKLTLPPNLAPIRHAGATDDERLRILYVALTRAKIGLHLTSYTNTYAGKTTRRLKYFNEQEQPDGSFRTLVLPEGVQHIINEDRTVPPLEQFDLDWRLRHIEGIGSAQLQSLLADRLKRYRLSPTHLNTFTNLIHAGPETFFFHTLLRFPEAPTVSGQFGNAIHETLEWVQYQLENTGTIPVVDAVIHEFDRRLRRKHLTEAQFTLERDRGEKALTRYLADRGHIFRTGDRAEYNFSGEGVLLLDEVQLNGKIDRLEIDRKSKTITVVDYKTGKNFSRWQSDVMLHKYRQQLYCYKLLIERSHTFADYTVKKGRLEFIEPDVHNRIHTLELAFQPEEAKRIQQLLAIMWQHVMELNFPNTSGYKPSLTGIQAFEADLLAGTI